MQLFFDTLPRSERLQLISSLTDATVARLRHLVPGPSETDERLRNDHTRLLRHLVQQRTLRIQLPQRAHIAAVVQRLRPPLTRVSERPHTLPIRRRDRHLDRVLGAMPLPRLLNEANHLFYRARRVVLQTERKREVEEQLRICRSLDTRVQRLMDGKREVAFHPQELAHEAVVNPEPAAVAKRVAISLLNGRSRRGTDVREEERCFDASGDLAQVAIIPGRRDASEEGRRVGDTSVPADTK